MAELSRQLVHPETPVHYGLFEPNAPIFGGGVFAPLQVFFERRAISRGGLAPVSLLVLTEKHLYAASLVLRRMRNWELERRLLKLDKHYLRAHEVRGRSLWGIRRALVIEGSQSSRIEVRPLADMPYTNELINELLRNSK